MVDGKRKKVIIQTDRLIEQFLDEINNSCFPVNGGHNTKIGQQAFLRRRFHPKNFGPKLRMNTQIASDMEKDLDNANYQSSIGTTCQNVVRTIVEQYRLDMTNDGVDINPLLKGVPGKKGAWQTVYTWLYKYEFPRWLEQENRIWEACKAEAQSNKEIAKIIFVEHNNLESLLKKPIGSQPRPNEQVPMEQPLYMEIELIDSDSEHYLLLLSRSKSSQEEEARYLFCPSQAFAPYLQPINNKVSLPLPNAPFEAIEFSELGTEEFLGILLRDKPNSNCSDFFSASEDDGFLDWNEISLYKFLQQLEQESSYQFFYQSFKVVDN